MLELCVVDCDLDRDDLNVSHYHTVVCLAVACLVPVCEEGTLEVPHDECCPVCRGMCTVGSADWL